MALLVEYRRKVVRTTEGDAREEYMNVSTRGSRATCQETQIPANLHMSVSWEEAVGTAIKGHRACRG